MNLDALKAKIQEALNRVGETPVRVVFKEFGFARVSEVPPDHYEAFTAALAALQPCSLKSMPPNFKAAFQARLDALPQRPEDVAKVVLRFLDTGNIETLHPSLCAAFLRELESIVLPAEAAAGLPPFEFDGWAQARLLPRATPALLERIRKNVPAELRQLPNWVCCDRSPQARKAERTFKSSKMPLNPSTGSNAKSNDAKTWGTFDQACSRALTDFHVATIGVNLLGTDFVGLDWDHVIDGRGVILPAARHLLAALPATYLEKSPSGTGLRGFYKGAKPAWMTGSSWALPGGEGNLEAYDKEKGRYLTCTGAILGEKSEPIHDLREGDLDALREIIEDRPKPSKNGKGGAPRAIVDTPSPSKTDPATTALADAAELVKVRAALEVISPEDRDLWLKIGMALHRFGACGREEWNAWSRKSAKFDQKDSDKVWTSFAKPTKGKRPTVATIYHHANLADKTWRQRSQATMQVELGQRDPATGKLVFDPKRTVPTAEAFVREFHQLAEGRTIHCHAGLLLRWSGNRYAEIEDGHVSQTLQHWLHGALRYSPRGALVAFEANPTTVGAALTTIQNEVHLPVAIAVPCWLDDKHGRPPVSEVLVGKSKSLHIPTGQVLPATPLLFNTAALSFDYDPEAPLALRWSLFLDDLFGDDIESHNLLQDFFGYCLTGDTSQQKMLLVVGPRRSGKGTLARVLRELVGLANCVGPTTSSLAGNFGLQPLIGKSVAVVSDARFVGEGVATLVERLLCISGEDDLTIDRKFLGSVTMKLPTRFVFLTNELPRFHDSSSALVGRFLVLKLTKSFYGTEDTALTDKLLTELPGILLWALEGWRRLHERGRFVEPASSKAAIEELEDLSSPVGAFVRDRCVVGSGYRVSIAALYMAWRIWCIEGGRSMAITTAQTFGRDLGAALPGIRTRQSTDGRFYEGVGLVEENGP